MKNRYIMIGIGVAVILLAAAVVMTSNPISRSLLLFAQKHGIISNRDMTVPQPDPQEPLPVNTGVEKAAPGQATLENNLKAVLKGARGNYSIGYKSLASSQEVILNPGQMPSASVIKLFIMTAAYNQAATGQLKLDDKLVLRDSDKVGGTGSLAGRPSGTSLTIRQLIELMITESDNTAANLLIDKLGFDY
ncbi:MAG: serine hydrolase, partial [Syntrophomonas sp.]